jgi:hypothetical protein
MAPPEGPFALGAAVVVVMMMLVVMGIGRSNRKSESDGGERSQKESNLSHGFSPWVDNLSRTLKMSLILPRATT